MHLSRYPLFTQKETPADAEIISHRLMLRGGLIRRVAAGIYTWLPLGLRVLRKVEAIVRAEMNRAGAIEVFMPAVQPAELWQESGRWQAFGPELLRLQDRHERDFCVGPTHEEVITDLIRNELKSYKQLPVNFYQIQTKFRDEVRPRFGVMRAREFIMKDAYSFDMDEASLEQSYQAMYQAYNRIFTRLGLGYRAVLADSGSIGGTRSQEFHVLADSGEDAIAYSTQSDYAANIEMAEALAPSDERPQPTAELKKIATPGQHTIAALSDFLHVDARQTLKTLLVAGADGGIVALCLRGDHELNALKAEKLELVAAPLRLADENEIHQTIGCGLGSLGPVGLSVPIVCDRSAAVLADFVCGANEDGYHLTNVNWGRDLPAPESMSNADPTLSGSATCFDKTPLIADIRNVLSGDKSPDGNGMLAITRGIEVGHIFQLGQKYSKAMNASILDENGRNQILWMGCYGIGITRIVAAAIEQNHDERGIIWPQAMAPFQLALLPINAHKSERLQTAAENLYQELRDAGIDVLMDDRGVRPGVMFSDTELIGIPHRIVLSERGLDNRQVEYKGRRDTENQYVAREQLMAFLTEKF